MTRNYNDFQYKMWRQNIKKLDNYSCRWPGCSNTKGLQVHHIKKWSEFPGLRYHPNNGITLCKNHHNFIKGNEESYCETFFKIISRRIIS